jgi:AcrR family transcriptional regulator
MIIFKTDYLVSIFFMATTKKVFSRKDIIKETALGLFSKYGFHAVSTDMIIEKAGVSKGLLFFHFRNKNELLKSLLYDWMSRIWTEVYLEIDEKKPPIKCLELTIDSIYETLNTNEQYYRLYYSYLLTETSLFSKSEMQNIESFQKLKNYLYWLFKKLGAEDVKMEVKLFSNILLGMEFNFLIHKKEREKEFKMLKKYMLKKYSGT